MKTSNIIIISILLITLLFSTSSFAQPDYSQEVNSSDILKQIENGEDIYISDSVIKGKLNLSNANLSEDEESGLKIVRSKITILNSHFENSNRERVVDFSNTIFENEIEFDNCNLYWVDFSKSHFKQDVIFKQSKIYNCNFSEIIYHKKADFRGTDIFYSNFEFSIFNGQTLFDGSILRYAKFYDVTFTNSSSFERATFKSSGNFKKSTFSNTSFKNVIFEDVDVDFIDSNFTGLTKFNYIEFGSDAYFTNAIFLDDVDFSKSVFIGDAYFNNATFKKNADFERVKFNKVNFIETTFEKVSFIHADFSIMYVDWYNIKDSLIFDGQFYLKLREKFTKLEDYDVSDDVYYEYRKNIGKDKDFPEWFLDRAVLLICGYGVKPMNTIVTGVIVVLGFAGYYYCKEHCMSILILLKKWQKRHIPINIAMQNAILHLLDKFKNLKIWTFPAVSSFMSHIFKKNDKFDTRGFWIDCWDVFWFSIGVFIGSGYESSYSKNRYQKAVMLEKIIGSLIFTLFVVTLANVMIRV